MTARKVFNADFNMNLTDGKIDDLLVNEPDNGYFGIIRRLTNKQNYYNSTDAKNPAYMKEIIFLDCSYDNKIYSQEDLNWAKQYDDEQLKKLNDIKMNLEKKKQTDEVIKKLEKVEFSISKYSRVYDRYEKKNKNTIAYEKNLDLLIDTGFVLNGIHYYLVGMSGNMARHGIKGFVSEDIYDDVMAYSYLIDKPKKCKIPKYEAYRNLLFTSCRAYVDELPRICVIDDYSIDIPNVSVKYPADGFYVKYNNDGSIKEKIPRKVMKSDVRTITINCFDGAAIHSSEYNNVLYRSLPDAKSIPKSYQLRLPFVKGVSTCFDLHGFCREYGIEYIKDIDGSMVPQNEIDILMTQSMYKGADFFPSFKVYYEAVKDKGFKLGISNYNKSAEESAQYVKANYQYLQNISALTTEDLIQLSHYFTDYVEKVLNDPCKAIGFLKTDNEDDNINETIENKTPYTFQALQLCPEMAKDECVRSSVTHLLKNAINQAKNCRILIKGGYKYLVPDLYMLMCWAGKNSGYDIEVKPCLKAGEMYCTGKVGRYSVFRSPQLLENEINVVNLVENDITKRWFGHLDNILIVNSCSADMMRMQTADYDGDEGFLCEEDIITSKVKTGLPLIINVNESKPPVLPYTKENIKEYHKRTLNCLIGEITNKSCCLHNKTNQLKTTNQLELDGTIDPNRIKTLEDLEYLSIQIQLETDYVKAGIRWDTPADIEYNLGNLPYFMRYRYLQLNKEFKLVNAKRNNAKNNILKKHGYDVKVKYDKEQKIDSKTETEIRNKMNEKKYRLPVSCCKTPLNGLCQHLEKWTPIIRYKLQSEDVSELFMPTGFEIETNILDAVKAIYEDYLQESAKRSSHKQNTNWNVFYKRYLKQFENIGLQDRELLFYLIKVCYVPDNKKSKNIVWSLCGDTIIEILKERNNANDKNNNAANEADQRVA
jgi:hypothetical protein